MKSRVTITLMPDIIKKVDDIVAREQIINRSSAIERILREYFNPKTELSAVVLAGGKGTRLRPLTYEVPKSMIPVKGKPILEYIIQRLKDAGISNIMISIGYLGEKIQKYFGDGSAFGVKIKYLGEETPLGTGGALKRFQYLFHDTIVVVNGDNLFDFDISQIYAFHRAEKASATIAVVNSNDTSSFGVVEMNGNKIISFVEKPSGEQNSHLVNAGVYVLNPSVLSLLPEGVSNTSELFQKLAAKNMLTGFVCSGKWFPCDNMQLYEKALKGWP
ncbi:sugar phosphate nucleotidyltransferase [Candidatus Parvarchaeota archaeon]|nr:sugar phosphate nucleotidyltransferase [Candidatus Parvarchaeota archaeon]